MSDHRTRLLSVALLQSQRHFGDDTGRNGYRRSDCTVKVQQFVGTLIQFGEHRNERLATADCPWPYPGMDALPRGVDGPGVDFVPDEVIPHAGHVHHNGTDVIADVEYYRTTGRRGFPCRPVVMAVVMLMPMLVVMRVGVAVLRLGLDVHAVTKAVRSRTR
jgi:hypothetical protein